MTALIQHLNGSFFQMRERQRERKGGRDGGSRKKLTYTLEGKASHC